MTSSPERKRAGGARSDAGGAHGCCLRGVTALPALWFKEPADWNRELDLAGFELPPGITINDP